MPGPRTVLKAGSLQAILTATRAARDAALAHVQTAANHVLAAAGHANAAAGSATTAAQETIGAAASATNAATSASESVTSRNQAVAAKDAAVTAKNGAETAASGAGQHRDETETLRNEAGNHAGNAGAARDGAVGAKDASVAAKNQSEAARDTAGLSAASANAAANRARQTAARIAGALGGAGDARARFGSAVNVWATVDRMTESTVGPVATMDEQDGPYIVTDPSSQGDLSVVAWEVDVARPFGNNPLGPAADACAFMVETLHTPADVNGLALTVELLNGAGATVSRHDGLASSVQGYPHQIVASEAIPLVYGQGDERAQRARVTVSLRAFGQAAVTVFATPAPYVRAGLPEIDTLTASKQNRLSDAITRGAGVVGAVPVSGQDWFINSTGTLTLPAAPPDRTRLTIWHDVAAGNIALAVTAPGVLYDGGLGAMNARGQHRTAVFHTGAWRVS